MDQGSISGKKLKHFAGWLALTLGWDGGMVSKDRLPWSSGPMAGLDHWTKLILGAIILTLC